MDMSPPATFHNVHQAEAYFGTTCVIINNSRTEKVVDYTRSAIPRSIIEVADFQGFLDATAEAVSGRNVVLTLGDSTTANVSNWPYALADNYLNPRGTVVLNLADWARASGANVPLLDFYLHFLASRGATGLSVILILGMRDIHDRLNSMVGFMGGDVPSPLTAIEEKLLSHRHGGEVARLAEQVPSDWDGAPRWIARRILVGVKIIERICAEANAQFFAILEPSSYADFTPSYMATLRQAFEMDSARIDDFDAWCSKNGFVQSPSNFGPRDHRPYFDQLRMVWEARSLKQDTGHYMDWSALFGAEGGNCYQPQFDAVHYNALGSRLIAEAVSRLFP